MINLFILIRNFKKNSILILFGIFLLCLCIIFENFMGITSPIIALFSFFSLLIVLLGVIYSLYLPSSPIYKFWKHYGANNEIIDKIQNLIGNRNKDFYSFEFTIIQGWLIKQKDFIFVNLNDINWVYVTGENEKIHKIKIYTSFGANLEIEDTLFNFGRIVGVMPDKDNEEKRQQKLLNYYSILKQNCKNAYFGNAKGYKAIWDSSPQDFIKNINTQSQQDNK